MLIKKHLSIVLSLLVSLPSKVSGFYFTIEELSEFLSVGGCPHRLVNVDMVRRAIRFNRGKVAGISSNKTNGISFYKIKEVNRCHQSPPPLATLSSQQIQSGFPHWQLSFSAKWTRI